MQTYIKQNATTETNHKKMKLKKRVWFYLKAFVSDIHEVAKFTHRGTLCLSC